MSDKKEFSATRTIDEYEKSEFYSKYKNTYFSDAILKAVIQKEIFKGFVGGNFIRSDGFSIVTK